MPLSGRTKDAIDSSVCAHTMLEISANDRYFDEYHGVVCSLRTHAFESFRWKIGFCTLFTVKYSNNSITVDSFPPKLIGEIDLDVYLFAMRLSLCK